MTNITEIMNMIDWHMPLETQFKGRNLAKNIEDVSLFIQPLTPKYNKNVWDNCAEILSERKDEELKPHLVKMLEWLQDMNWPGAFCVFDRLKNFSDNHFIHNALSICVEKAKECNDETWKCNLYMLMQEFD